MYVVKETLVKVWENFEKALETLACGSCSHSISRSPKLPLVFLIIIIIISALSQGSKRFTTLCGGLCQTAYFRRKLQPRSSKFIRKNSMIHRCPQIRISDKPSHWGHRPLIGVRAGGGGVRGAAAPTPPATEVTGFSGKNAHDSGNGT